MWLPKWPKLPQLLEMPELPVLPELALALASVALAALVAQVLVLWTRSSLRSDHPWRRHTRRVLALQVDWVQLGRFELKGKVSTSRRQRPRPV